MNPEPSNFRRQQAATIATIYVAYATSMILRMIPTVAGTSIKGDASLGIGIDQWTTVLSAGTCGAMIGKFICGWAADKFGGHRTFAVALFVASAFVGLFAMSSTLRMFQLTFFITLMAQSAGWPSMTRIIVNWVAPSEYGRAWGILSTSSRVGTLTATFILGSVLAWLSWRGMMGIAAGLGLAAAIFYSVCMTERPVDEEAPTLQPLKNPFGEESQAQSKPAHPFDGLTLQQFLPHVLGSLRFWLICGSLMGLTILWDFLLLVPMYLQDTLHLTEAQASRAASAFPLGSLISVLTGGFVFDKLKRRTTAWVMAGLLSIAAGCLLSFPMLAELKLTGTAAAVAPLGLLFLFGVCVSPCYYIPCSVFSIDFGGPRSGFLVSLLDAVGFAATAIFYYFGGSLIKTAGWNTFISLLATICAASAVATFLFMHRHARKGPVQG
ncbi:MAG: MFS transporter [Planctomycetaceae bacterium]|nr:MFS transporter [Planctomycetaceae bacterium]